MTTALAELNLVELSERASRAAAQAQAGAHVIGLTPIDGGQSSLTFSASLEGGTTDRIVVKVAPPGLAPVRNRDVLRQARVLRGLAAVPDMKVPSVLFDDAGEPPGTPPLFAMTFVEGYAFEPHLDDDVERASPGDVAARARVAARLLASLHHQEAARLGLGDEPVTSLTSELDRWDRAFEVARDYVDGRARSLIGELRRCLPLDGAPSLLHGDYRLGNILCAASSVNAIIDWEIWNVGDARCDLGWFLLCSDPGAHPTAVRVHPGMPAASELQAEYERAGGATAEPAPWFRCLALTKMAATTALIARNNRRAGRFGLAGQVGARVGPMLDAAVATL